MSAAGLRRALVDVAIVASCYVAYDLCVGWMHQARWGWRTIGCSSVFGYFHLYLLWLPPAAVIYMRLRRHLGPSPIPRSFVAAALFAPCWLIYLLAPLLPTAIGYLVGGHMKVGFLVWAGFQLSLTWLIVYVPMEMRRSWPSQRPKPHDAVG